MNIVPLFIFDRDEYAEKALASLRTMVLGLDDRIVMVDDREHRLGFAGAIQEGWDRLLALDPLPDYVLHCEGDFTFHQPVPALAMALALERNPYLCQMALKRQAVNEEECAAGGIVECHPDDFEQWADRHAYWTEHRRFFSTNPSVYSTKICRMGWPQVRHSEGIFTHQLLEDPTVRFAFWGKKFDPPLTEHIGLVRAGHGY